MAVYFAPNSFQGFIDAVSTAVHDATNNPSVISISWGASESNWTAQALQAFDQAYALTNPTGYVDFDMSGDSSFDPTFDRLAGVLGSYTSCGETSELTLSIAAK